MRDLEYLSAVPFGAEVTEPSPEPLPTKMPHTDAVVVLTTVANADEAERLVRGLLERRLIACGTLLPGARSLYRWEGKIADEQEVVVLLKTRSAVLHAIESAFAELHPYKVPELLALEVQWGLEKYVTWINDETSLSLR
jgi:periplasmic divalent cation tolerance protein